jgi:nucleoside-diphosphate-sugar epimerase
MATHLVTGSVGFIDSRLSGMLLHAGHHLVGKDNHNTAYGVRLKDWRLAQLIGREGYTHCSDDICDFKSVEALFNRHGSFDGVINQAARASVRASIVEDPQVLTP